MLNKTQEEALKIILDKYDGNTRYEVSGEYQDFPEYIQSTFRKITEAFESLWLIARADLTLSSWSVTLTPEGISYFVEKKRSAERGQVMFNKLPSNSKKLLDEILRSSNPTAMLRERIEKGSREDDELRSLLKELKEFGYINITWASDLPYIVTVNNSAKTYEEKLREYERQFDKPVVTHITYNGDIYGIATTAAITDSTINISTSIQSIQRDIESKGGEDKETLQALLEEVKTLIGEIEETKQINENPTLFQKISSHARKHGWFYGALLSLIGQAALQALSGM